MLYLLLKSLHILAVIIWLSGLVALALGLMRPAKATLELLASWDKRVTSPAMALVWLLGLALAYWAGWFGDVWLWGKLAAVFVLSGVHGMLSGQVRRAANQEAIEQSPASVPALVLILLLVALAVVLVETKLY